MNQTVDTQGGAVAAGHTETARVGAQVLADGGNAVDAAVAMIFVGTVVEGTLTSLGGGGFMLIDGGTLDTPVLIDFYGRQPGLGLARPVSPWRSYDMHLKEKTLSFGTGPPSVAVPGMPGGLARASRTYGRLPLTQVAAPAAELATTGVPLSFTQADEHELLYGLLTASPDGQAMYHTPQGPRNVGVMFRQEPLAATIEEIAATSARSFYEGAIADRIVRWSDDVGARITREDLASFMVLDRTPLSVQIGSMRLLTNPAPSMGGPTIAQLLPAMLAECAHGETTDAHTATALAEVLDRLQPPLTRAPVEGDVVDTGELLHEEREAMSRVTPQSAEAHDAGVRDSDTGGTRQGRNGGPPHPVRSPHTTHVCARDSDGMVVTATHSIGFGSGEFIPGTGVHLNNMLAEYDYTARRAPGSPIPSMMSPALVEGEATTLAIGSAGSDRIPQAISQVLARMVRGDGLHGAMEASRFVYDGSRIHCEPGFDAETIELVERRHGLVHWTEHDAYFGTVIALSHRGGVVAASGDRRREGAGVVL